MSIFGRRKRADHDPRHGVELAFDQADRHEALSRAESSADLVPGSGPFDSADVAADDGRIDFGALRIAGAEGMEIRLEIDQTTQGVLSVAVALDESVLQLQAFAAPRTAGIWDEIREEIAEAVEAQSGTAEHLDGPTGTELRTRMPSAGPDGRTVIAPARFLGHDGPRWFLRGVLSGRAAIDDEAARPLVDVFRSVVVVRGPEPMAPRELLALRLPVLDEEAPDVAPIEPEAPDLNPFERGPEITEVR